MRLAFKRGSEEDEISQSNNWNILVTKGNVKFEKEQNALRSK